jgi:hypothetical protein
MEGVIRVTIRATESQTQILVQHHVDDLMIGRLGPQRRATPRSLSRLLEFLAGWFHCRLHVVLCAASEQIALSTGLVDPLGFAVECDEYVVYLVLVGRHRGGRRLRGLGLQRALRRDARRWP